MCNDLDGGLGLRFTDVTAASGMKPRGAVNGYGMGVASGDFDNDGRIDFYVTALGPNRLLRNRGDGTFEDVSEVSGLTSSAAGPTLGTLAADLDGDRRIDLYEANVAGGGS